MDEETKKNLNMEEQEKRMEQILSIISNKKKEFRKEVETLNRAIDDMSTSNDAVKKEKASKDKKKLENLAKRMENAFNKERKIELEIRKAFKQYDEATKEKNGDKVPKNKSELDEFVEETQKLLQAGEKLDEEMEVLRQEAEELDKEKKEIDSSINILRKEYSIKKMQERESNSKSDNKKDRTTSNKRENQNKKKTNKSNINLTKRENLKSEISRLREEAEKMAEEARTKDLLQGVDEFDKKMKQVNEKKKRINELQNELINVNKEIETENKENKSAEKAEIVVAQKQKNNSDTEKSSKKSNSNRTSRLDDDGVDYMRAIRFEELRKAGVSQKDAKKILDEQYPLDRKENYMSKIDYMRTIRYKELRNAGVSKGDAEKIVAEQYPIDKRQNINNRGDRSSDLQLPDIRTKGEIKQAPDRKLIEMKPNARKPKIVFNIRTGMYTYTNEKGETREFTIDRNFLNKKTRDRFANAITNSELGMDLELAKKVDFNLYAVLSRIDEKMANQYVKAFKAGDKEQMPIDLTYDIRRKGEEENKKKLKFIDKMKMKSIAKIHGYREVAEVQKDKSLLKKMLLGLGIAGASATVLLNAGNVVDKEKDNNVNIEETGKEQEPEKDTVTPTPVAPEQTTEQKQEDLINQIKSYMKEFKETNYVSVLAGQEYTNASDIQDINGRFVEDTDCQIANRAIVKTMPDGSEQIVATTKGRTWEEAGIDVSQYNSDEYTEKYALEGINGAKDSRGYSIYGWVNADKCAKLYETTQEINGKTYTVNFTKEDILNMVQEKFNLSKEESQKLAEKTASELAQKTADDSMER